MAVYKRDSQPLYSYDFRLDGARYSGSTGTGNIEEARRFEQTVRAEIVSSVTPFCRAVLKKAMTRVPPNRRARLGYVYMMQSRYFIKIGHSRDPVDRFRQIDTATPEDSELLFYIPGGMRLERELHAEFDACHYQREWFFLCGKLKRFIDEFVKMRNARQELSRDFPLSSHEHSIRA